MKKIILGVLLLSVALFYAPSVHAVDTSNFTITDYKIDYYLTRDNKQSSKLQTTETITAKFPDFDQNHGIYRYIPNKYQTHSVNLKINSITDLSGKPYNYSTSTKNDNTVIKIGDANSYVKGITTYVIKYDQQDVTNNFNNTNSDEFYWDANGTGLGQPIDNLDVRLSMDADIAKNLTGNQACYVGFQSSNTKCSLTKNNNVITTNVKNLNPNENVSIAVGFQTGTFAQYKETLFETLLSAWILIQLVLIPIQILAVIVLIIMYRRHSDRTKEQKTIIPEYLPPANYSLTMAGSVISNSQKLFSAQIVDFAVRKYILIKEISPKKLLKKAQFELELIKGPEGLKEEEIEVLTDIFYKLEIGRKVDLQKSQTYIASQIADNSKLYNKLIKEKYNIRAKNAAISKKYIYGGIFWVIFSVITLSPISIIIGICIFICSKTITPLTDSGLELFKYLKGMEMYIKIAEADRLKMLQSPEGALRIQNPIDVNDKSQVIKLYERMLPYAILFGQEKSWNKQLGVYYQQESQAPYWYAGSYAVFDATSFSDSMNNFSSVASPSDSSDGGSYGGGSSGGGGGGGGGGGW